MFPYTPITPSHEGGMAFQHNETGEILEFDASWFLRLDRVEEILWQNHTGDFEVVTP